MVDSETRWRLVRALKQKPPEPEPEIEIRSVRFEDLPQIRDIYNYFIRNTVITFDDKPLDLHYWQDKQAMLEKFDLPFIVMMKGPELIGFAYVAPWRAKAGYLKVVENQIYLLPSATGRKLGGTLMQALIDRCRDQGIKEVIAVIADRGAGASIALHKKFGFKDNGHLANVAVRFGKPIGSHLYSLQLSSR
ncbi:MAG TPA: GNAT family N-acetyltransferase [Aquiluna sp.]